MEEHLRQISKLILMMLVPLTISSCGGGGGSNGPAYVPITNAPLVSALKDGTPDFPGIASFIDTKVVFQGGDMFLGLSIAPAAKALITKNVNSFLETSSLVFDSTLSPLPTGVTIDPALKKIMFTDAGTTVSWSFSGGSVVRSYVKSAGAEPATWTYSYSAVTGLTTAVIKEPLYTDVSVINTTKKTSYSGTVLYARSRVDSSLTSLTSADFTQTHSETNSVTGLTWALDGNVKMTAATTGNLSFDGGFSSDIPSYKTVSGKAVLANGTYDNNAIINSTKIDPGTLTLTSQTDYSGYVPVATNPVPLQGTWVGTFTDTCSVNNGDLQFSISETAASWYGMSHDLTRNYGTLLSIATASSVRLSNNTLSWGASTSVSATTIDGTWSYEGCGGFFKVIKQ